jgi:heme O synthase-like polyprenyltransferase
MAKKQTEETEAAEEIAAADETTAQRIEREIDAMMAEGAERAAAQGKVPPDRITVAAIVRDRVIYQAKKAAGDGR